MRNQKFIIYRSAFQGIIQYFFGAVRNNIYQLKVFRFLAKFKYEIWIHRRELKTINILVITIR
jgi:hypothetical protein